jgi:hypothetical protein
MYYLLCIYKLFIFLSLKRTDTPTPEKKPSKKRHHHHSSPQDSPQADSTPKKTPTKKHKHHTSPPDVPESENKEENESPGIIQLL